MNALIEKLIFVFILGTVSYCTSFIIFNACIGKKITQNFKKYLIIASVSTIADFFLSAISNNNFMKQIIFIILLGYILASINKVGKIQSISILSCIVTIFDLVDPLSFILFNNLKKLLLSSVDQRILLLIPIITIMLVGSVIINIIKRKNISIYNYLNRNKTLYIFIFNCYICVMIFNTNMVNLKSLTLFQMIEIFILGLILIGGNIIIYRIIDFELEEKKKLEIEKEYTVVINDLIDEFRANQHEYKNHLNTLSAIVHLNQGMDSLKLSKQVDDYIEEITKNDKYSKLMYIDNIIIKAIIYNNISKFENLGINFIYEIKSNLKGINVQETDVAILLNNLLNNSIEATKGILIKNIKLYVYEENNKFIIKAENTIEDENIDYGKIFEKKESSKGENRGFGLYNVKNIVEKYKGKIEVSIENGYFILICEFKK